ncbi:DNA-directed RNA polymerase III subunit RPC3 [Aplysia californica]|uniref:DNA-directed RNA polymerase III subunit RPC3 n=1 Tax=Aplysia californica TaxID=6500 RepID=A0ABM0K399_APLCA|nr:DNA-directed RNA polymerase III subunit RPC3 [Aplysia californica]
MLYGDAAELLVEELLLQGQSHLDTAVMKTTKKLNDSIVSSGASLPEISHNVIKEKVVTLVKARLIRRCEGVKKDENEKVVSLESHTDPNALFALPTAEDFRPATGSKRPQDAGPQGPAKRIKLESGAAVGTSDQEVPGTSSGPGYWCVNFHQFHHHFRDQAIIAAVSRNIDQRASEVMRTMLRLSETRTDPTFSESVHLSFTEISSAMPKDKAMNQQSLDQYLKCLSENCHNFVTRVGDSGGGMFQINYYKAIRALSVSLIESIVLERFGSKALRMFKVILAKRHVEQKQVEEHAMLPPKEAKELLYKMFAENYVSLTELSKTPDHAPARTFYLFNVNLIQVSRMILEKCYKAVANVMIRRDKCISENKRLLDKQERVEAIIASLDAEGAVEQKEEVEQMVTPSERAQLKKVGDASKTLEQSEIHLDHTIFLLETFLNYTLKPPPQKVPAH